MAVRPKDGVKLRRLTIIALLAALAAMLPVSSGAAPAAGSYSHDVKVFHQVRGKRSRPLPAQIALLVGGKADGKLIPGLKGRGKQFIIAHVTGAEVTLTRHTGPRARVSLDVGPTCRGNPQSRYFIRATAVIAGKTRTAFSKGECSWVMQVLERDSRAVTRTTFIFEN